MGSNLSNQMKFTSDQNNLKNHVEKLVAIKPGRDFKSPNGMNASKDYIINEFKKYGYEVILQDVQSEENTFQNIIVKYNSHKQGPVVVVGAHYDTAGSDNPGADDNASGVAGLLEIARLLKKNSIQSDHPIELVAYTLEEPPYFGTKGMGSAYHADKLKEEGKSVKLMISIEMIGYFSDELFSQKFPMKLLYFYYPWRGNFIALVGSPMERKEIRAMKKSFNAIDGLSNYSINAPSAVPGIDFSDHRNYWAHDWPAVMVSDTAFYRNLEYHKPGDTPDRLNYKLMKLVVDGTFNFILNFL